MAANQICEMKFVKKDGTSFYGRLESIATQDPAGNLSGWRTAIVNVTARKQAEKALAESREELNSIIRSIPDIIYRLDRNGPISFVSDSIDQLGYRPESLIGKQILEIVHPEDREIAVHRINERRTGKRSTKSLELRLLVAKRGVMDFRVFSISAEGLYISKEPLSDTFQGTQGIARDITDRKLAQQELLHREKIQGALETAGAVCHEMNQPMMVILGCSELALMNASESDPVYDKILKIKEQIDRMKTITENLMKITRYETKRYANIENIIDIDKSSQ